MTTERDDEDELERDASDEEDPIEILDALMQADTSALPPVAPDGGFTPTIMGEPAPIPEATPETMICLAGPCRHLVAQVAWFPAGNTEGSPGYDSRERIYYCDRLRSAPISLSNELVYTCNAWTPISDKEVAQRAKLEERLVMIRKGGK